MTEQGPHPHRRKERNRKRKAEWLEREANPENHLRRLRAIQGLQRRGYLDIDTAGNLFGAVDDARMRAEVTLPGIRMKDASSIPPSPLLSSDVTILYQFIKHKRTELPAELDRDTVASTLQKAHTKILQAEEKAAEKRRLAEERRQQVLKRKKRRKILTSAAAIVVVLGAAGVVTGNYIGDIKRRDALAYEQTHELNEPTTYSNAGWRVEDPHLTANSDLELIPEKQQTMPLTSDGGELTIFENGKEKKTGITVGDYERVDGEHTPRLTISGSNQEVLLPPDNESTSPDTVLFKNTDGEQVIVNIRTYSTPEENGETVFAPVPLKRGN